jgi:hypothetical protein
MSRPKGKITNCPHTDREHFALGRCKVCYNGFHNEQIGISKGTGRMPTKEITACEHTGEPHYARGMCQICYQRKWKAGEFEGKQTHQKMIPAWKIVKGLEEGKSYYEIAVENHVNPSVIIGRCKTLGIHISRLFTNAREIKKMSRIGHNPNRIVTVSQGYFKTLGIDTDKELYYKLTSNPQTKRIEIQVMDKQEAKAEWENDKKGRRARSPNPYLDDGDE